MILARYRSMLVAAGVILMYAVHVGALHAATTDPTKIVVKNFMFTPMSLTVKAGSTVTWENMDEEPHTVVSNTGLFHSGALDTNESFSFKFDKPGTYQFACSIHPRMVGTIIVQ
jgi:plastocyanin